ncbi:MAG: hypothetical protein IJ762_00785 [Bacteroidaceae bacterium]|nr:hypothetical protein [Bacteroidaceae bacterium]
MKRLILSLILLLGTVNFALDFVALFNKELCTVHFELGSALRAQVTVEARIDSMQILLGEQTGVTLSVTCDAKSLVEMPVYQPGEMMTPLVPVMNMLPADTARLNGGKRMTVSRKYLITSFDVKPLGDTLYNLPPLTVKVDGREYPSNNLALKVYSMPIDTVHLDQFFPPKTVMPAPFAWEDWRLIVWSSLLLLLLVVCATVLSVSLHTGKPLIQIIRRKVKLPAHKVALTEIERIKTERTWAQEDSKEYYTQLTDTLRTYIQDRYGFSAMEMTSGEIIDRLTQENDEEALRELRELFQTADLVKFAKYQTLINENDANLMTALEYINQTKKEEDPNQKPEEIIITPEAKRQRATIWTLRITIALASLAALALLSWVVYRVIDLLR